MKIFPDLVQLAREVVQISLSRRLWDDEGRPLTPPEMGYPVYNDSASNEYRVKSVGRATIYVTVGGRQIDNAAIMRAVRDVILPHGLTVPEIGLYRVQYDSNSVHTVSIQSRHIDKRSIYDENKTAFKYAETLWSIHPVSALIKNTVSDYDGGTTGVPMLVNVMLDTNSVTTALSLARANGSSYATVYDVTDGLWNGLSALNKSCNLILDNVGPPLRMQYSQTWGQRLRQHGLFRNICRPQNLVPYHESMGTECDMCASPLYDLNYTFRNDLNRNISICPFCMHSGAVRYDVGKLELNVAQFPATVLDRIAAEECPLYRDMLMCVYNKQVVAASVFVGGKRMTVYNIGDKYVGVRNKSKFVRFRLDMHIGTRIPFLITSDKYMLARA